MKRYIILNLLSGLEHSGDSNPNRTLCAYAGQVLRYLRRTLHEGIDVTSSILYSVAHLTKLSKLR